MKPTLTTVADVEIMHAGVEYSLSTGPATFTPEDLRDVVMAANEDPSIPAPRLKLGHIDPRYNDNAQFDGTPAFGKATNLRLSENGMAVMADYVGVPSWLAPILPTAYPSRSIEGFWGIESQMGKKYRFVLSACALLGVTWPGITVLEDLPQYYGEDVPPGVVIDEELIAASRQPGGDKVKIEASANMDDVRRAFYNDYLHDNPEYSWWWIQAILVDPNELVVEDDETGDLYKVSFSTDDDGNISFGDAEPVKVDYIPDDRESKKAAATHVAATLAIGRTVLAAWPTRAASSPDKTGGAMDPKEVRKQLELPEDSSDEQVHEALLARAGLTVIEGEGKVGPAVEPVAAPVVVAPQAAVVEEPEPEALAAGFKLPPGAVLVDEATWASVQEGAAAGIELKKTNAETSRKTLVAAAVSEGRIPPARAQYWRDYLDKDPEGGAAILAAMQPNSIPLAERGHGFSGDDGVDVREQEQETVSTWSEDLFPEVRHSHARAAAVAAGTAGPRQSRVSSDAHYTRR